MLHAKPFLPLLPALWLLTAAHAGAATIVADWTVNATVPDNSPTGLVDTRFISGSSILGITSVEVRLEFSGGWNGDLHAYLTHDSGYSVLLNRPGRTALNSIGAGSSGMVVTLSDVADIDIHTGLSASGLAIGTYQPDARAVDPALSLDTSPRTAFLSNFHGLAADGAWTLFVSDQEAVDQSTLVGWGLTINGVVPEPSRAVLLMFGLGAAMLRRRRSRLEGSLPAIG
jgi:subtilisin-like proprotein convertase family protein